MPGGSSTATMETKFSHFIRQLCFKHMCISVHACVCICICVYICICMYIYVHTPSAPFPQPRSWRTEGYIYSPNRGHASRIKPHHLCKTCYQVTVKSFPCCWVRLTSLCARSLLCAADEHRKPVSPVCIIFSCTSKITARSWFCSIWISLSCELQQNWNLNLILRGIYIPSSCWQWGTGSAWLKRYLKE